MTTYRINVTGCVITVSGMTGDVLCRRPTPACDCLMTKHDMSEDEAKVHGYDPEPDLETCSWCTFMMLDDRLVELPDGARVCGDCHKDYEEGKEPTTDRRYNG
jgi:hypothetical protein